MSKEVVILIADDDSGHVQLIEKNLQCAGLHNPISRFENGQEVLNFLFRRGDGLERAPETPHLLLLDIRMPKIDGVEALRQLKADPELRKLTVSMLTTTDYERFSEAIKTTRSVFQPRARARNQQPILALS